jgi:hypothetical protein
MFERRRQALISRAAFVKRRNRHGLIASASGPRQRMPSRSERTNLLFEWLRERTD